MMRAVPVCCSGLPNSKYRVVRRVGWLGSVHGEQQQHNMRAVPVRCLGLPNLLYLVLQHVGWLRNVHGEQQQQWMRAVAAAAPAMDARSSSSSTGCAQ